MPIIATKAEISVEFLIVNDNGTVASIHPVKLEADLSSDGFLESLEYLVAIQENIESQQDNLRIQMRSGKVWTLGRIQAATMGIQSQYQFPTTVGTFGQVIGYQGSQALTWITISAGLGYQGNRGFQSATCAIGYQGNQAKVLVGGLFLPYTFNSDTGAGDPTSGKLKLSTTFSLANYLLINETDRQGCDHNSLMTNNLPNNSTIIISTEDSTKFVFYRIGANVTDYGTYRQLDIVYIHSVGAMFSNNDSLMVMPGPVGMQGFKGLQSSVLGFQGAQGPMGSQGSQGSQGSPGYTGAQGTQGATGDTGYDGIIHCP